MGGIISESYYQIIESPMSIYFYTYNLADISKENVYDSLFILNKNRWKFNWRHLVFGCLAIAFITFVVAISVVVAVPSIRKSIIRDEKKKG